MKLFPALFFAASVAAAQAPQVPSKMSFADLTLSIRDDAQREIQKDVDALTLSPKHFNIKAERAKTYFPIIEKIFAEEGVPDDFKYLVLQESALISDAVSVSNAVGFWQFKDFTAVEMGLRVDNEIDERKNLVSSTRAAAKYIKKNNTFFDNWLFALQAYQMGAGGVMRSVKDTRNGSKHAEITSSTYWYVKKFLAHKIAFENGLSGQPQTQVIAYETRSGKTLSEIAQEVSADEVELQLYNKWTRSGKIPTDKSYTVLVPITKTTTIPETFPLASTPILKDESVDASAKSVTTFGKINGVKTIVALEKETPVRLAERARVDLSDFLKWNDISISSSIVPGGQYFLGRKRVKAIEDYHQLGQGESLWAVSQKYGVQLKKLRKYNRLKTDQVAEGTTLWLSATRPKSSPAKPVTNAVAVENETFNWEVAHQDNATTTIQTDSIVITAPTIAVTTAPVENPVDSSQNLQTNTPAADTAQTETIRVVTANNGEHVVQPKETLYAIAKLYGIGVMDLVKWNNLSLQEGIKPGQVLKITDSQTLAKSEDISTPQETASPKEIYHEVKTSDTLYGIARKYGVTIKDLMEWNSKKDFSLSVGEKLKVVQTQ